MQRTATTNSFPTINPAAAAFSALASALDGWTQSCVATANQILPLVPVYSHLDFSDIKSTALFAGSQGVRCSEQFDFGWACGASSYVASYVKLLSVDVDLNEVLANPVVKELLAAWASPQCSMFILQQQQRAVCAALLVGKKELPVVEACIAGFIDETFSKAGRSTPPTDNQKLYDQVCQRLGTFTYGFTVDQGLGVILDELTAGGSTAAATAKDVKDFGDWARKLYKLLGLPSFVKEHAERIPACRKLFRP